MYILYPAILCNIILLGGRLQFVYGNAHLLDAYISVMGLIDDAISALEVII